MSEHELWNELGNLYFMSGAYNQAIHAYERSIQCDTTFGRPYSNLALTYVQQGKYEEAIELYSRSIELLAENEERAISWNRLGAVYRHLKDYSKAVIAFQEADLLDPRSTDDFPPSTQVHHQASEAPSSVLAQPAPQPVVDEPAVQAPEEPVLDEIIEQPVAEAVVEDIIVQAPEELVLDEIIEQPVAEAVVEDVNVQAAEEPVLAEPVEEPVAEAVLADAIVEAVEERVLAEPVEEPVAEAVVEDIIVEAAQEQVVEELPDQPVAEAVVEDIIVQAAEQLVVEDAVLPAEEPSLDEPIEEPIAELTEELTEAEPIAELNLAAFLPQGELPAPEPQPELELAPVQAELERDEPEPEIEWEPLPVDPESAPLSEPDQDEIELWAIDEERILSATSSQPLASLADDDPNASWTPADTSQFQQSLSQMPETGSLTTWGDGEFDNDFEFYPGAGADNDQDVPDPEAERIATWIPLPEEAPLGFDEIWIPPFVEEDEAEAELPLEWNEAPAYHVINSGDYAPAVTSMPEPAEYVPVRAAGGAQQAWNQLDVDVAVEERPAAETAPGAQQSLRPIEPTTVAQVLELEPIAAPSLNAQPPALPDCERDEDEMREIEMGIAKFRRVVQVNPRNAHAWDALGTLYKSAGLYKDAILAYQQAISNDSSKSLYYHHLGLVYACEGRDEDAIGAFQHVLEIDPDYSLAHATLGGYYRKMGLEELAQKHIGKAMKNIFDSENEYNRACLEAICGNTDQAIELLGVALKNKQTYVDWILRDPDLDFIRQDPRFKQLISDYTR